MARIELTTIFIPIIPEYIETALKTLYEKAPSGLNFRVIVVDQTKDGIYGLVKPYADLIIRNPNRINMGFSKANNEGIIHAMHWGSKYIAACNDDIEFIDSRWWQGIIDQFQAFPEMMAVCPASVIEPGWGWGLNENGWVPGNSCPDWGVAVGKNIYIKGSDGWFVVFKRETLEKVGLYDERFGPGGGEDYDYVHRIYCAGGRASATMRSFLWHYWSVSREGAHTRGDIVPFGRKTFADTNSLFIHAPNGANSPIFPPRDNEKYGNKRKRINPGIFIDDIR